MNVLTFSDDCKESYHLYQPLLQLLDCRFYSLLSDNHLCYHHIKYLTIRAKICVRLIDNEVESLADIKHILFEIPYIRILILIANCTLSFQESF